MTDSSTLRILIPQVTVVVHPINRDIHPTYPHGYRWAVMVGGTAPAELEFCANAGYEPTVDRALFTGESHGAAVAKGLRIMNVVAKYAVMQFDYDPIPAEADHLPLTYWR